MPLPPFPYKRKYTTRTRGYRPLRFNDLTVAEYLGMTGAVGNTALEKQVYAQAALMGILFDAAQYPIYLGGGFEKTVPDFMIFDPPTAIFVDGIQHELRPDTAQADLIKRQELETMGFKVIVLNWRGLIENAYAEVSKILYG